MIRGENVLSGYERAKRWELDMWIQYLYINRKPCMVSPMTSSLLTLSDVERSNSRSLSFRTSSLISCNWAELDHILLLHINRRAYKESPMTLSHLTLGDLERSKSRSLKFWSIICRKGAELAHVTILLLVCLHFPLVTLKDQCQGHSDLEDLYLMSF